MLTQADPNSLMPSPEVSTLLTVTRHYREAPSWGRSFEQIRRDRKLPAGMEYVIYESAYALWCALRLEQLSFYWLGRRTHAYQVGNPRAVRMWAWELAAFHRHAGRHALADWAEGRRSFGLGFLEQLRDEERSSGWYADWL